MSPAVDVRELADRLDEVLAWTARGREVLLLAGGEPCARLLALDQPAAVYAGASADVPEPDAPLLWA